MATNTRAATRRPSGVSLTVSAEGLVNGLLFFTILISFVVFIEPAPYEGMVALMAMAVVFARVRFDPLLAPMIFIIAIWALFGAFAVMPVTDNSKAITYYLVSIYLALTSLIFACLLTQNTERRLATLERAYILAAFLASVLGIIGYFNIIPSLRHILVLNGRAQATFKDPNVFGPYLILPLLLLIQGFLYRGFRLRHIAACLVILMALLLSFSRGAWGHFVVSALVMLMMIFWTNKSTAFRLRILRLSALAVAGIAGLLALLLSFGSIGKMFSERANLVNYYDAGENGRFGTQLRGLMAIFDLPNGLGPHGYSAAFGIDPHDVYLAALYAYGWVGGIAYLTLALTTLVVGFRGLLIRAPWQPVLIAAYATFLGVALEGFIIDTDHWRHYFLLLGMVWGLTIASLRQPRPAAPARPARPPAPHPPMARPVAPRRSPA